MNIQRLSNIVFAIIIGLAIGIICYHCGNRKIKDNSDNTIIPIDTSYNRIVLDSIEYNIIKRDSIIYNIKLKIEEDEKEIIALDDSSTVKLFLELANGQ